MTEQMNHQDSHIESPTESSEGKNGRGTFIALDFIM